MNRFAIVGLLLATAIQATALPLPSESNRKRIFPEAKLDNPAIRKLVGALKKVPTDYTAVKSMDAIQNELASFGDEVIPYMVALSDKRRASVYFMDMHAGWFGWVPENPYMVQAGGVISRIRDPKAVPALKKLVFNPVVSRASLQLSVHAQGALREMQTRYTFAEVEQLVGQLGKYGIWHEASRAELKRLLKMLSPDEADQIRAKIHPVRVLQFPK